MASTVWENMNASATMMVTGDIKPWGGICNTMLLDGARVKNINIQHGASFDEATIVFENKLFGQEIDYFLPIKIISLINTGELARESVLFRGFVVKNSGELSSNTDQMQVHCSDYKWFLSRRSLVRGRWYALEGAVSAPSMNGSGITVGDSKFVFEKFRANLQDDCGYLQTQECVFNKGGIPDCFTNNHASSMAVFYYPRQVWDETKGFKALYNTDPYTGKKTAWKGKFWTWATILAHLQTYWIRPYDGFLTRVDIHSGDLSHIAQIAEDRRSPIDFSLENTNVITAIDTVVRNLPGRWFWYIDYSGPIIYIRIKEFDRFRNENVYLKVCDEGAKLATSGANVAQLSVTRDGVNGTKYAIARGRSIKLTTTIKLVPLWQRYADNVEFATTAEFERYKYYAQKQFIKGTRNDKEKTDADAGLTKAEEMRFERMFRYYAIPLNGETFVKCIATPKAASDANDLDIKLTGFLTKDYNAYTVDLKKMLFKNIRIERGVEPPNFSRYNSEMVVFAYDDSSAEMIKSNEVPVEPGVEDQTTGAPDTVAEDEYEGKIWLDAEQDGLRYKFDKASGVLVFDEPQFCQMRTPTDKKSDKLILNLSTQLFNKVHAREIYLTATFTLDVGAILGRKTINSVVDYYSGAPFPTYVNEHDVDIIVHQNAWYPIRELAVADDALADGENAKRTLGGHKCYTRIKQCDYFDDYQRYSGTGAQELLRALLTYLDSYDRLDESIDATLPYIEVGYQIGDKLCRIHGTQYYDLNSVITSINYENVNDSDQYNTVLHFANFYNSSKDNVGHAKPRHKRGNQSISKREVFEPEEKLEGVD